MSLHHAPLRLTVFAAAMAAVTLVHAQQAAPAAADAAILPVQQASPKEPLKQAGTAPADPVQQARAKAPARMQTVEVRASLDAYDPRRDDTASKIVLNHEEIVKYGDTTVLDVLKRLPGVTVSGGGGRGGEVRMRGLGSGYTQVLINGERAPAGFSMDSLAPDVIERIEVLRAASAEFSTQSIAGTINIVLKKAIKTAQRELKLGLGAARDMIAPNLNLQLSDRAGKLSYSLALNAFANEQTGHAHARDDEVDALGRQLVLRDTANINQSRFSAVNIAPRLNWALENGDTLTSQSFFNLARYSGTSEARTVSTVTSLERALPYPNIDSRYASPSVSLRSDLNWVHKLAQGARLDLKFGLSRNVNHSQSYQEGYAQPGVFLLDRTVLNDNDDQGASFTGKYTTPIVEGHALAAGWDGGDGRRTEERTQRDAPAGAIPLVVPEQFDAGVKRLALYAQDEWNVTPRWSVYLGARWEGIRTLSRGNAVSAVDSRTSVLSPLFQTLWKLPGTKGDQVRLALTRTYKAPPAARLLARRSPSVNNSQTEPDYQGNPNLRPELAWGIDASYEHYWGQGALLSVSTSMRRIDGYTRNGLIFDASLDQDGRWVSLPMNDGKASTRGLELEAKFPLKTLLAAAPALDLRASVSRNWSSVDAVPGPNNRLDQQTPLSGTLGADYKGAVLSGGASFSLRSGGPVRMSVEQTSYSSVRRELETYALWKVDPKNQLRLTLSNLLKQDWISENAFVDARGTVRRTSVSPGKIVLRAALEMKY